MQQLNGKLHRISVEKINGEIMFGKQRCRAENIKISVSRGGTSTLKKGQHVPPIRWHPPTSSHNVTVQRPKIQRFIAVKISNLQYTRTVYF